MDRGAWWATVYGVTKESDRTSRLNSINSHRVLFICLQDLPIKSLCSLPHPKSPSDVKYSSLVRAFRPFSPPTTWFCPAAWHQHSLSPLIFCLCPAGVSSFAVSSVSGFLVSWPCLRSHPVLSLPASYHSPAWGVSDIHGLGGGSLSVPFSEAPWKPPYSLSPWNGKSRGSSQSFCWGNFCNVYLFS